MRLSVHANSCGLRWSVPSSKAIRRRVIIIPFKVTIPDQEVIRDLAEQLIATEGPGMLACIIDSCVASAPAAVASATEKGFWAWVNERRARAPQAAALSSLLYNDSRLWAEGRGE